MINKMNSGEGIYWECNDRDDYYGFMWGLYFTGMINDDEKNEIFEKKKIVGRWLKVFLRVCLCLRGRFVVILDVYIREMKGMN